MFTSMENSKSYSSYLTKCSLGVRSWCIR